MPTWCWAPASGPVGGYNVVGVRNSEPFTNQVGPAACVAMGAKDAEFQVQAFRWQEGQQVTGPWSEASEPWAQPVPEPGGGLVAALVLLAVLARRRRRRS